MVGQNFHIQPLAAKGQRLPVSGEENVKTVAMDVPTGVLRDPLPQTLEMKPGTQRDVARIDGSRPFGFGRVPGGRDSIVLAAAGAAAAIASDEATQDGGGRMARGKALVDRPRRNKGWRRGRGWQKGRCRGEQTGRRQQGGSRQPETPPSGRTILLQSIAALGKCEPADDTPSPWHSRLCQRPAHSGLWPIGRRPKGE